MKIDIYSIAIFFQWACMVISALLSPSLIKNSAMPKYMKNFYWYPAIAAATLTLDSLDYYAGILSGIQRGVMNNSLLLFHFTFLSFFIYRAIGNRSILKGFGSLSILFISIIFFCFCTNNFSLEIPTAFAFANFGLVIFCFFYYIHVFKSVPVTDLNEEPSFWIITGVFFCICGTVPLLALHYYLFRNQEYIGVESIISFFYGAMHLFFIKGYLGLGRFYKLNYGINKRQIQQ